MPKGITFCPAQSLKCITHPVLKDIRFTDASGPKSKAPTEAFPSMYDTVLEDCSLTR